MHERTALDQHANWRATDMADERRWLRDLSAQDISDLEDALRTAQSHGHTCATLTREHFPIGTLGAQIDAMLDMLERGSGIAVLRGVPAHRYTKDELRLMYWGIGLHMGTALSQSNRGDVLGDVRNLNTDVYSNKGGRGYTSNKHLTFHTDPADVVALQVLRPAKSGGLSMLCSSVAIHDEIARLRPDLLEVLYQPFHWSWKGQQGPGQSPWYAEPVYTTCEGRFCSSYMRSHILMAQEFDDVPRLTDAQREAMDMIDKLSADPRFHLAMMFEPGDIQFLNNHVVYHGRTEFEDHEDPDQRRHLLRMWLAVPNSRPLSPALATLYRDRRPGAVRGGFPATGGAVVYETAVSAF